MPFSMAESCHLFSALMHCAGQSERTMQCMNAVQCNHAVQEWSAMQCRVEILFHLLNSVSLTHTRNICTLLHCTAQCFVRVPERGGVLCAVPFQFPPDIRSVPLLHPRHPPPPPRSFHFLEKEPFGRFPDRCQSNFPPQKI